MKPVMSGRRRAVRWSVRALAAVGAILGCQRITDPPLPTAARSFAPPGVYERWWAMTQECSGVTGSPSSVTWYDVPDTVGLRLESRDVDGYWSQAGNRIVLVRRSVLDGPLVRHEMLHALLQARTHRRAQFLGACGGVVACDQACIDDAGPPPAADPAAVLVPPDSLDVSAALSSLSGGSVAAGSPFSVTITARNRASHPVTVSLPVVGQGAWRIGFAYDLRGPAGGATEERYALDPSRWTFAAGETKRQVFDFVSGGPTGSDGLPPGGYQVRGSYGRVWSPYTPFKVDP
jgi:hypothetical protein